LVNTSKGTYYSDLRAKNGHPEPYKVKIVDLGNEVDGYPWELGHKPIEEYTRLGREAAKALKLVDNSIKLVASLWIPMWNVTHSIPLYIKAFLTLTLARCIPKKLTPSASML
jgi:alpha-L-arabinofuranosidase